VQKQRVSTETGLRKKIRDWISQSCGRENIRLSVQGKDPEEGAVKKEAVRRKSLTSRQPILTEPKPKNEAIVWLVGRTKNAKKAHFHVSKR